jgi:hypothetical protein
VILSVAIRCGVGWARVGSMVWRPKKEATVRDPYIDYKLYREEMDRVQKQLELRRQLPEREWHLPHVRFSFSFVRQRRRQRLTEPSAC